MEGKVKFYNNKKRFGFVTGDDGKDYFFHQTNITKGTFIRQNDIVSFEPLSGEKGLKAEHITLITKGSELAGAASSASERMHDDKKSGDDGESPSEPAEDSEDFGDDDVEDDQDKADDADVDQEGDSEVEDPES
jgi:cold shock protein